MTYTQELLTKLNAGASNNKTLKLKQGGMYAGVRGVLTAVMWEDRCEICTYWQMCVNCWKKTMFVMSMREHINLPVLKATVSKWTVLTERQNG
jgi:hypothetical protein